MRKLAEYATIQGLLLPETPEDHLRLIRLAYEFRRAVTYATRMIARGVGERAALRELRSMLNKAYGDSAYKVAKMLVRSCASNGGDPRRIKIRKLFIISGGEASRKGNRNIRLGCGYVLIKYPFDGSWLKFRCCFGKYSGLIEELAQLATEKKVSYGARIVFRRGRIYLHLSVPVELYLKHFRRGRASGSHVAGFDFNSDRINMVIVDEYGKIRDARTEWFPEVTSHGYPRSKARARRLEALARLLDYAYHHGVGVVAFENLFLVKRGEFTGCARANRKISKFAKRQLIQHAILMARKYGFKVILVDPKGTTKSREHDEAMRRHGLDRHAASAYLVALRGIERCTTKQNAIV